MKTRERGNAAGGSERKAARSYRAGDAGFQANVRFVTLATCALRAAAQRPENTGARFSANAVTPSTKSREVAISCWMSASSSSCSSIPG